MDIVYLRDLKVETIIGIYEWERLVRQTLVLNIDMGFDVCSAAALDNIEFALDYNKVAKRIVSFVAGCEYKLIETVAEKCASIILHEFNAKGCRIRVSKPGAIPNALDVGVLIERGEKLGG